MKLKMFFICFVFLGLNKIIYSAEIDGLLDKLIEKGYLNTTDAQEVRNETVNLNQAVKKQQDEEIKGMIDKEKPKVKVSGYFQIMYSDDQTKGGKNPLTLKRARFAFSGKLNDWTNFKVQPDFGALSTGGNVGLREAWIDLIADQYLATFRIGQYHQPFGFENTYSSSKKKLSDTPFYMSNVLTSDYDYGIQWWGTLPGIMKDTISWRLGVLNGTTTGTEDNQYKDLAGRLVYSPVKKIEIGISEYNRYLVTGSTITNVNYIGAYAKYETLTPLPIFFTAECIGGKDSTGKSDVLDAIFTVEIVPFKKINVLKNLALVTRYELWDPNNFKGNDEKNYTTIGLNFYPEKSVRVLIDYVMKDEKPNIDDNKLNVILQVSY